VAYDRDWNLMATGKTQREIKKSGRCFKRDGGAAPHRGLVVLQELAAAPAGGNFEYGPVFIDKPDVYRLVMGEISGVQSYSRPFS